MDMKQAMRERHMVRKYTDKAIPKDIVSLLNERVRWNNEHYPEMRQKVVLHY